MPHDCSGRPIQDGDIVTIRAKVSNLSSGEKDCNCHFTAIVPEGVEESYAPTFAGNTKLATLVEAVNTCAPSPPIAHVLQFFQFKHLPPHLQAVSRPFAELANLIVGQSSNQETTIALRKLLEAKDAAVRAVLISPTVLVTYDNDKK